MNKGILKYYPNSVCFDNKDELKLLSNWFEKEYQNFFISIDAC